MALVPGPASSSVPQSAAGTNIYQDCREVVKIWGEDDNNAPKFTACFLWGAKMPTEGVWQVVTTMFMHKQQLLTIEIEPYSDERLEVGHSHKITIAHPVCVVQNGRDWSIPECNGVMFNGIDFPKTSGTAALQFKE